MAMSDCTECWETPCVCGHDYRHMDLERLCKLREVINRVWDERTQPKEKVDGSRTDV